MASKPRWLLQIPQIIEQLSELDAPVVDRAVCERLFGIKRRRAIELMQRFGGYRSGNAVLLNRSDLIHSLEAIAGNPEVERERERKRRLSEQLSKLEKHRRAAAVRIPVGPEASDCTVADLPAGISFEPGRLTVKYNGVEELLARLFELAKAAANDYDAFSMTAGGVPETASGAYMPKPGLNVKGEPNNPTLEETGGRRP